MFGAKAEETARKLGLVGFSVSDSYLRVVSVEPEIVTLHLSYRR